MTSKWSMRTSPRNQVRTLKPQVKNPRDVRSQGLGNPIHYCPSPPPPPHVCFGHTFSSNDVLGVEIGIPLLYLHWCQPLVQHISRQSSKHSIVFIFVSARSTVVTETRQPYGVGHDGIPRNNENIGTNDQIARRTPGRLYRCRESAFLSVYILLLLGQTAWRHVFPPRSGTSMYQIVTSYRHDCSAS